MSYFELQIKKTDSNKFYAKFSCIINKNLSNVFMSTTQILCSPEKWQLEPQKNLVEGIPVKKGKNFQKIKNYLNQYKIALGRDLRGFSFVFEED